MIAPVVRDVEGAEWWFDDDLAWEADEEEVGMDEAEGAEPETAPAPLPEDELADDEILRAAEGLDEDAG